MTAALVKNLQTGQARLDDQLLAEALTLAGDPAADEIATIIDSCEVGNLGQELVSRGKLSAAELARISSEIEVATLMESVGGEMPRDVRNVSGDPERRIGRYVLVDELGAGGMGVVWKTWDGKLSRWVAIKQVKVQEPQLIRRFMQEAKLLAGLTHPNITQVYEVGVHAGKPFLAMELVDGTPPGNDGALERKQAAKIVCAAAQAVQYAHDRGIIHRDLKPSNLLVSREGRIFVTDFGLARMRENDNNLTQTGALLGTPAFMAPEQAQAQPADNRTDIYGLGATLYALVTGEPPHRGEIVHEIVKRVAVSNPPTLDGNDDLVVVAQMAMERDREDRYQTAGELAADLQRFIDDEPIAARPIHSVERAWRRAKRRPVFSASVLAIVLVVMSGGGYAASQFATHLARQAEIAAAQAPIGEAEAIAAEIKRLVQSGGKGSDVQRAAIARLDTLVAEALELAPNYSEANYLKGMSALWQGDNQAAIRLFTAALGEDPNHVDARARRTVLQLYTEVSSPSIVQDIDGMRVETVPLDAAIDERLASLEAELLLIPADYPIRRLGDALLHNIRGEFVAQRDALEAYLVDHSYDLKARSMLPWAMLSLGDYGGVEREAQYMLQNRFFPGIAQYLLSLSYAGRGRFDEAIRAMEVAQEIEPDPSNFDWIATWSVLNGQPERALVALEKLLEFEPDNLGALLDHADIALGNGMIEVATSDLRAILAIDPSNGVANYFLAEILKLTDPLASLQALQLATESPSIASNAWIRMGFYQLDFGAPVDALAAFEQAAALTQVPQIGYGLFQANRELGRLDAAQSALNDYPDDAYAHFLRADLADQQQRIPAALSAIDDAIQLAPEQALYRIQKAHYLIASGNLDNAEEDFLIAERLSPNDPWVFRQQVEAWRAAGQSARLRSAAERWLQSIPESDEAQRALTETAP